MLSAATIMVLPNASDFFFYVAGGLFKSESSVLIHYRVE